MNLSELIEKVGNDKVRIQFIDNCAKTFKATKAGTNITFVSDERFGIDGAVNYGIVVWIDRKDLKAALESPDFGSTTP